MKMHPYVLLFLLSVCLVKSRPQYYHQQPFWRTVLFPPNNGYQFLQRYQETYENIEIPKAPPIYKNNFDYSSQHRIPIKRMNLEPRVRGPARDMIQEKNAKTYDQSKFNENGPNIASSIYNDTGSINKKIESTRILNHRKQIPPYDDILSDQGTDFVFPGRVNIPTTSTTTARPPITAGNPYIPDINSVKPKCKQGFCVNVDYYPANYISNILRQTAKNYTDLLGVDEIATQNVNVSVATRIGVSDDSPMCASKERIVEPKVAQNKDDQWLFIVNEGQYIQGIRVEICENESDKCSMSNIFPINYKTECRQKYIYRKLLAINPNGEPTPDTFKIPSCCSCYVRNLNSKSIN